MRGVRGDSKCGSHLEGAGDKGSCGIDAYVDREGGEDGRGNGSTSKSNISSTWSG